MRNLKWWLLGLAAVRRRPSIRCPGNTVATDNVKARLISEADAIAPGQSIWVALELDIRDGWHTYWRNPGDSGQATQIGLDAAAGFTAGDIVWTTPHRFEIAPLVNYGYAKHAMHLVQDHGSSRTSRPAAPLDARRRRRAGWSAPTSAFPRAPTCNLQLPVTAAAPAHRSRPPRRCSRRRAASCPSAAPAATQREDSTTVNWC